MGKYLYLWAFIIISQFSILKGWASGVDFKITGNNIERCEENGAYTANITIDEPLEIIAQGWVYPRSRDPEIAKGQSMKADAGTWMFDDNMFQLLKTHSDETQHILVLKAKTPGQYKIRFVGVVLNYTKSCEILVNISKSAD